MEQKLKNIKNVENVRVVDNQYIITSSVDADENFEEFQQFQKDVKAITGIEPTPCDVIINDWIVDILVEEVQ